MKKKSLIDLAALGLVLTMTACSSGKSGGGHGKCYGVNACKGSGACGVKGKHACSGKNECKGQGWVKMSKSKCKAKGGNFKKKA